MSRAYFRIYLVVAVRKFTSLLRETEIDRYAALTNAVVERGEMERERERVTRRFRNEKEETRDDGQRRASLTGDHLNEIAISVARSRAESS